MLIYKIQKGVRRPEATKHTIRRYWCLKKKGNRREMRGVLFMLPKDFEFFQSDFFYKNEDWETIFLWFIQSLLNSFSYPYCFFWVFFFFFGKFFFSNLKKKGTGKTTSISPTPFSFFFWISIFLSLGNWKGRKWKLIFVDLEEEGKKIFFFYSSSIFTKL